MRGCVRYLQDVGLNDTASSVHHVHPFLVVVDELKAVKPRSKEPITISPVTLFAPKTPRYESCPTESARYTFMYCSPGSDSELDRAAEWMETYATKYEGRVITNFDEQRPILADAPLSYQRLVTKSYDRTVIENFGGTLRVDRIDRLVQESIVSHYGDIHMGHNINVGGSAVINIDSVLSNVTQTISTGSGLDSEQKSKLDALVQSLRADLEQLKASHADEVKEIADALEKAVANAVKPREERKQSLLQLSAKGLKEAAELVKDIAPSVLTTAGLIAKFVVGL